jgi:hypothetical protein
LGVSPANRIVCFQAGESGSLSIKIEVTKMTATVEILGLHPVQANEPVHLLEIMVRNSDGVFDIDQFTQEISDEPKDNWQVPYDEKILNANGDGILADGFETQNIPELWTGNVRLAFFFHFLDVSKTLNTPFGDVRLPEETERPSRLAIMEYEEP